MPKQSLILATVLCCLMLTALSAAAGEMSGSGKNMFIPKIMSSMELADGTVANRMVLEGFIIDDTEGSPLALASMQCAGTTITGKDETPISSGGTCDSVDGDGDVAMYWWRAEGNQGKWGFLGGTGKWEGVEGGGTYEQIYQWLDGKMGNAWKGTWTMK